MKLIKTKKRKFLCFVILILIGLFILDCQLRPLIKSVAANQAQIVSTNAINQAIINELQNNEFAYSELVHIDRDESGKILAINTDIKKVNLFKSIISEKVQNEISNIGTRKIYIPIGTLTGTEILNGRGPSVPMKISMSGTIVTDLKSTFESAGINQTHHKISIDVSTKIFALIPGYPVTTAVETNMAVAETIIVGNVPTFFANAEK